MFLSWEKDILKELVFYWQLPGQMIWTWCVYSGISLILLIIAWEHQTVTTVSGIIEELTSHVL